MKIWLHLSKYLIVLEQNSRVKILEGFNVLNHNYFIKSKFDFETEPVKPLEHMDLLVHILN